MKKITGCLLLAFYVLFLSACVREASTPVNADICKLMLDLYIRQGPNAGDQISGQVTFGSNRWEDFKGDFISQNGLAHPVSFSFDGQATHFLLDLERGQLFGAGIMESGLAACSGKGGGTLSGPALGDLGDWRGEWILEENPNPSAQPIETEEAFKLPLFFAPIMACLLFTLFLGVLFIVYERVQRARRKKPAPALRRTTQISGTETGAGGRKPLAEYLATYIAGDKLFDLSFEIEKSGQYCGECGISMAHLLDQNPTQVTALELWLFDANDVQTMTKVLMSSFCYGNQALRAELEPKGEALLMRPGDNIILETKSLRVNARILQLEYAIDTLNSSSIFKKAVITIGVWEKELP